MESRLIYIASKKMRDNLEFDPTPDFGWLYFGAHPEVNMEIVNQKIFAHFSEDMLLFIAHNRIDSIQTNQLSVIEDIKDLLGRYDFSIGNTSFNRVINFDKIGVLRCDKKSDS